MKKIFHLATIIVVILFLATGCKKWEVEPMPSPKVVLTTSVDTTVMEGPSQKQKPDLFLEDAKKTIFAKATFPSSNVGEVPVTLYVDADGENNVAGAPWGISGSFNCPKPTSTDLSATKLDSMLKMVKEDFSPFLVNVVKTLTEFQNAPGLKMRIILTKKTAQMQASSVLNGVPAVAYISSLLWNDGTPCFVFINEYSGSSRYKMIAESISHELGHTFGLYHQSELPILGEYRWPSEDLQNGAIMGNPYQAVTTRFIDGPSRSLNWQTQYDAQVIAGVSGWKDEPYCDVLNLSTTPVVAGTIITTTLVHAEAQHAFQKATTGTKTLRVKSKGNGNFAVYIYSSATDPNPVLVDPLNTNDVIVGVTGKKFFKIVFVQPVGYAVSEAGASYTIQCN